MNKRWIPRLPVMLLAALLIGFTAAGQKNNEAEVLLQAAAQKATVEGNLQEAIRLCQQILTEHPDNRPAAAKALIQIGECYEKLGKEEALKAYERVLSEYADQSEQVQLARSRLAALAGSGPTTLTTRMLDNPPADAPKGAPSPDGRYLSFWDWRTGNLAVRDLQSGKDRTITTEGNSWGENVPVFQEAGVSTWSPDGKQIAYVWNISSGAQYADFAVELRVVGLDGGKPRVLSRYDDVEALGSLDWSADGKQIVALIRKSRAQQLAIISVADGSTRILADIKERIIYPTTIRFSPDGRYAAYESTLDNTFPERDIFLISIGTGQVTPLIQHPADDYLLGWSQDGRWIALASDRTGTLGLWVAGISGARTEGEPRLLKAGIAPILPLGLTREGALYYGVVRAAEDIYVADLDPKTGKVNGPPRKVVERFEGGNFQPSYSPDGKFLAYASRRGNSPYPTNVGNALCIRSIDTGQERVFYREILKLGLQGVLGPKWYPGGLHIVFGSSRGVYRIDLKTSEITHIYSTGPDEVGMDLQVSPGGEVFLARGYRKKDFSQMVVRNMETGEEQEIYRFPRFELRIRIAVSSDGRWLAFLNNGQDTVRTLRIIPAVGGTARDIWDFGKVEPGAPSQDLAWSHDGRYILFNEPNTIDTARDLWRIPVEGGVPEKMGLQKSGGIRPITVRPDGRQLAFASRGAPSTASEIWVIENFLPEPK